MTLNANLKRTLITSFVMMASLGIGAGWSHFFPGHGIWLMLVLAVAMTVSIVHKHWQKTETPMANPLKEKVTIEREVPSCIADLVHFAKSLAGRDPGTMSDKELIEKARDFWDSQHGED